MKFSSAILFALLNTCFVSCQPVPEVQTVFVTYYTTIQSTVISGGQATAVSPVNAEATSSQNDSVQTQGANLVNDAKEAATSTNVNNAQTVSTAVAANVSPSAATSTGSGSTGSAEPSSGIHSGQGTFYSTGLGACGETSQDTDYIVAVSHILYENNQVNGNSNDNPLCGKKIKAFYEGKSVEVTVVDSCEGCAENSLDFSPSAFSQLANQSLGRIDITWEWVD